MATQQPIQPAEETLHHLNRLSQKPGVQSTLILSRDTGAIVRASGLLVSEPAPSATSDPTSPSGAANKEGGGAGSDNTVNGVGSGSPQQQRQQQQRDREKQDGEDGSKMRSAEEVARSVWRFFGAAGGLVEEMKGENEDEVKLLRLRLRRSELMVVPDAKFLLVVVHDTPAA